MNTVFSRSIILLLLVHAYGLFGQCSESSLIDVWKYPDFYKLPSRRTNSVEADLYQPLGVSNLLILNIQFTRQTVSSFQKVESSFLNYPGFSQYYIGGEIGRNIHSKVHVSQHIGFAVLMSQRSPASSFLLFSRNLIKVDVDQENQLLANIGNFPSFFWPASGHVRDFYLHFYWVHNVYQGFDIRLAMQYQVDSELQLTTGTRFHVNDNHILFAGFTLRPFNLGIGYVYVHTNFRLCFMLEQSPVFGFAPYTSAGWEF